MSPPLLTSFTPILQIYRAGGGGGGGLRILDPGHTTPFSSENDAVLFRIRLPSTLQRRKRSVKTDQFKNALQSGTI